MDDYVSGNDLDDFLFEMLKESEVVVQQFLTCESGCPTPQSYNNELDKMKDSLPGVSNTRQGC